VCVVLDAERWLELRRFRALRDAGLSISEIARETGLHRTTIRYAACGITHLMPTRWLCRAMRRTRWSVRVARRLSSA